MPIDRFAPFRHRDFRIVWGGNLVSLLGSQMTGAALNWHAYDLTHDLGIMGLLGLCRALPIMTFGVFGGVLADALDRRRTVILTKLSFTLIISTLAFLTFTDRITIGWIFSLMALSALTNTIDNPTQRALVVGLVPREQLPQTIAYTSMTFQFANIAGPTLAGFVLAFKGPGWVYVIDALSFLFVIAAFLGIHFRPASPSDVKLNLHAVGEGLSFLKSKPILWNLMLIDFLATLTASIQYMIPAFATDILGVGPQGYGFLMSSTSLGALCGALLLSFFPLKHGHGAKMLTTVGLFGLSILVFGLSTSFYLSLACLFFSGLTDMVSVNIRQSLTQLLTPDRLRGRLSAINLTFFAGGPQLGEWKTGVMAAALGAPLAAALGGGTCVALAVVYALGVPWLRKFSLPQGGGQG